MRVVAIACDRSLSSHHAAALRGDKPNLDARNTSSLIKFIPAPNFYKSAIIPDVLHAVDGFNACFLMFDQPLRGFGIGPRASSVFPTAGGGSAEWLQHATKASQDILDQLSQEPGRPFLLRCSHFEVCPASRQVKDLLGPSGSPWLPMICWDGKTFAPSLTQKDVTAHDSVFQILASVSPRESYCGVDPRPIPVFQLSLQTMGSDGYLTIASVTFVDMSGVDQRTFHFDIVQWETISSFSQNATIKCLFLSPPEHADAAQSMIIDLDKHFQMRDPAVPCRLTPFDHSNKYNRWIEYLWQQGYHAMGEALSCELRSFQSVWHMWEGNMRQQLGLPAVAALLPPPTPSFVDHPARTGTASVYAPLPSFALQTEPTSESPRPRAPPSRQGQSDHRTGSFVDGDSSTSRREQAGSRQDARALTGGKRTLCGDLDTIQEEEMEQEHSQQETECLQKELAAFEQAHQQLKSKYSEDRQKMESENAKLKIDLTSANKHIKFLKQENADQHREWRKERDELKTQVKVLEGEKLALKAQKGDVAAKQDQEIAQLRKELEDLRQRYKQLQESNLNKQMDRLNGEKIALESKLQTMESQVKELQKSLSDADKCNGELYRYKDQLKDVSQQNQDLQQANEKLAAHIVELQSELAEEKQQAETIRNDLSKQNEILEFTNADLCADVVKLEHTLIEERQRSSSKIEDLQKEIVDLKQERENTSNGILAVLGLSQSGLRASRNPKRTARTFSDVNSVAPTPETFTPQDAPPSKKSKSSTPMHHDEIDTDSDSEVLDLNEGDSPGDWEAFCKNNVKNPPGTSNLLCTAIISQNQRPMCQDQIMYELSRIGQTLKCPLRPEQIFDFLKDVQRKSAKDSPPPSLQGSQGKQARLVFDPVTKNFELAPDCPKPKTINATISYINLGSMACEILSSADGPFTQKEAVDRIVVQDTLLDSKQVENWIKSRRKQLMRDAKGRLVPATSLHVQQSSFTVMPQEVTGSHPS